MTESAIVTMVERFAREDVRSVLARFAVDNARRAVSADPTEEVVLIDEADFARVDVHALTVALMGVLPHMKVWVAADGPVWSSEPI